MFGKHFQINDTSLSLIDEIGRHMPGGFFIYKSQTGELIYANRSTWEIYGCKTLEEFREYTGFNFKGMIHPDDYAHVSGVIFRQIEESSESLDHVEYRIVKKDGTVRWVDDFGHYTETDAYGGLYYVFISDITEKKEMEQRRVEEQIEASRVAAKQQELEERLLLQEKLLAQEHLRAQEKQLITALASDYWSVYYIELDTDSGICYQAHTDIDDGYQVGDRFPYLETFTSYCNRYVCPQYRDEFLKFIQPDSIREGLKEQRVISFRYLVSRRGKEFYEMVRFAGVRHPEDRDDHVVHAVGGCFTNVDAETRKSLEQNQILSDALVAAQEASKAKTSFLSNMSHEIRTPMNAIIGLGNIALSDPALAPKTREQLEKIGTSAHHLLDLINDILDMSRIESGRMVLRNEEFSFPTLLQSLENAVASTIKEKELDYHVEVDPEIATYYIGDNTKLRQILLNVIANAAKFTPKGGRVDFRVKRLASFQGKTTLRFTVSDTGIGISEEFLPHVFDAFAQEDSTVANKYGSSGLGMAITKNLVTMMNGNISVASEKGKGTTFTISLTLVESVQGENHDQENVTTSLAHARVILIDDDPIALEDAKRALDGAGASVDICNSGPEAIDAIRLRVARRDAVDLVLVDWRMPGLDGVGTTEKIRKIVGEGTAIIILTADRYVDNIIEAVEAGADGFLQKPLSVEKLAHEYHDILFRRKAGQKSKADLNGRHILLAEDMDINAEIITMILQQKGITVDRAENGRIALEKFQASEIGGYDAVLMDMRMPEMDGLEASRHIRELDRLDAKSTPIIALTANAFDEDVERSLQSGLDAHLSKPVEPAALFEALENLIRD